MIIVLAIENFFLIPQNKVFDKNLFFFSSENAFKIKQWVDILVSIIIFFVCYLFVQCRQCAVNKMADFELFLLSKILVLIISHVMK